MSTEPTFKAVLAEEWDALPPVFKAHYANRPYTSDVGVVEGRLDVEMSPLIRFLRPLIRLSGMFTPWEGRDIACTVRFLSEVDTDAFIFERAFVFPEGDWVFRSKLMRRGAHDVIEYMKTGIGWRCSYSYADGRVTLKHKGYVWRLFGVDVPLPFVEAMVGVGHAWEVAESGDVFAMRMELRHWAFRKPLYSYAGRFRIVEVPHGE